MFIYNKVSNSCNTELNLSIFSQNMFKSITLHKLLFFISFLSISNYFKHLFIVYFLTNKINFNINIFFNIKNINLKDIYPLFGKNTNMSLVCNELNRDNNNLYLKFQNSIKDNLENNIINILKNIRYNLYIYIIGKSYNIHNTFSNFLYKYNDYTLPRIVNKNPMSDFIYNEAYKALRTKIIIKNHLEVSFKDFITIKTYIINSHSPKFNLESCNIKLLHTEKTKELLPVIDLKKKELLPRFLLNKKMDDFVNNINKNIFVFTTNTGPNLLEQIQNIPVLNVTISTTRPIIESNISPYIITDRLIIRSLRHTDVEQYHILLSQPEAMQ